MKKLSPVIRVIPNLQGVKKHVISLSEKTIQIKEKASNFLTEAADMTLFISRIYRETLFRDFEFRGFLHQCIQIGYKTLPLISVTGNGNDIRYP